MGTGGVEEVSDSPSIGLQGVTSHPGVSPTPFPAWCHSFGVVETVPVIHELLRCAVSWELVLLSHCL